MAKNDAIKALAKVCMTLDRLQVELCEDTPYPVPGAQETRKRILSTFDGLKTIEEFINELKTED